MLKISLVKFKTIRTSHTRSGINVGLSLIDGTSLSKFYGLVQYLISFTVRLYNNKIRQKRLLCTIYREEVRVSYTYINYFKSGKNNFKN